jgi:hypothetical protein
MRHPKIRQAARNLRSDGWSLREIATHLDVSLGRTSEWVRDITLEQRRPAPDDAALPRSLPIWTSGRLGRCARCGLDLPIELFSRLRDGRQGWCKPCFRDYHRGRRDAARDRVRTRIDAAQEFIAHYLDSHPCVDCGHTDPVVLEFDHLVDKRSDVSSLVCHGASLARIADEVARCEVVCVNCHRRRTSARSGSRRQGEAFQPSLSRPLRERNHAHVRAVLEASGCVECGERDLIVLDFDHIDEKSASVSQLAAKECSIARIDAEIARCVVRCANCHRRRTAEQFGYYRLRAAGVAA